MTILSCYNFDTHESNLTIFGRNVTKEVYKQNGLLSPPLLTSASALPAETGNPKIAYFHLNTVVLHCENF